MVNSGHLLSKFVAWRIVMRRKAFYSSQMLRGRRNQLPPTSNFLRWSVLPMLLVAFWPSHLAAAPSYCSSYPTTIESITPQAGIAGVTQVYVLGTCFGDTQGTGTVTINGTQAEVSLWSDGEIVFTVPFTATTGHLVVTSNSNGYDSSALEADCANVGWCGTATINADFAVTTPDSPPFYDTTTNPPTIHINTSPSAPEYITGEWSYDTGYGETATYDLTQQSQNSDGTWPVTGSVHWVYGSPDDTCDQSVTGTLDRSGHLILNVAADPTGACGSYSDEYSILSSGDMTSQGYFYFDDGYGINTPPPLTGFPNNLGDENNDFPLFSNIHQFPDGETPWGNSWSADHSQWPTKAEFFRTMPPSGGFFPYAGRFVWEQDGGLEGNDGCYTDQSPAPAPFTRVTGGGWYVDSTGVWGDDLIGIPSQWLDWYQAHYSDGCTIQVPQAMNINTSDESSTQYTTNQLIIKVWPAELCVEVMTIDSQIKKLGLAYPPTPGTNEGPNCVNDP